jgi:3-oxoacyl-[acyl-carrier protein] reductase
MDLKLQGKRALVLGASRGLGFATARGLALEGCEVAINSRDPDKLACAAVDIKEASGIRAFAIPGDVSDPAFAPDLVSQAVNLLGGLDLLVTNAGGPPSGAFEDFDEATWAQAVELSFLSHVRVIRAALPTLRKSTAASVLTITSYSVKQPVPNLVLSNSIRAATVGLTKSLALELGGQGIRFNSILPGWTQTERVTELMAFRAEKSGRSIQAEIDLQMADSPLGRMATPEEFANAAVFLLSPAAGYITGVMLPVDGGMVKGTF